MHRLSDPCRRVVEAMVAAGAEFTTSMTPAEMRDAASARPVAAPPPVASVRDIDAGGVPARLYHPVDRGDLPLVVFFHGGGFVLQFTDGHDTTARNLANASGCAVLAVDYRLAPEHPFPAAFDDAWTACRWAFEHSHDLGVRSGPIGLVGGSAGGNLAAAVALQAVGSGVEIGALALVYPVLDMQWDQHESFTTFADAPILTADLMLWFRNRYAAGADFDDWRLSPLRAESVAGLPPTTVVAAEIDPLRSEGERWVERLGEAGVETTHHVIPGTFHAFFGFVDHLEESRRAHRIVADHLCTQLGSHSRNPG